MDYQQSRAYVKDADQYAGGALDLTNIKELMKSWESPGPVKIRTRGRNQRQGFMLSHTGSHIAMRRLQGGAVHIAAPRRFQRAHTHQRRMYRQAVCHRLRGKRAQIL